MDKFLSDCRDSLEADWRVVHISPSLTFAKESAQYDPVAAVYTEIVDDGEVSGFKACLDASFAASGPDKVLGCLVTKEYAQGIDNNRLAGPGLSSEDVQPRLEDDCQIVDYGKILDPQFSQHSADFTAIP